MRRTLIAAAAVSAATLASSAFAGFTYSATTGTVGSSSFVEVFALNNGGETGTKLNAVDLIYNGTPTRFGIVDGEADLTNADGGSTMNNNEFSGVRLGTAASTFVASESPVRTDPSWANIGAFQITYTTTNAPLANSGAGYRFARFTFPTLTGVSFQLTGQVGGDTGSPVPLAFNFPGGEPEPHAPTVAIDQPTVTIDATTTTSFGPVTVTASDQDNNLASLVAGAVPGQIADNISIVGDTDGPLTINGSGFTPADVGTYQINFTASDSGNPVLTGSGTFTLNVVIPEPTTLAALAGVGLLALRRRK